MTVQLRHTGLIATLTLAASLSLGACSGLEFVQDQRLTFLTPTANTLTKTPVTLTWSMKDYTGQGKYAVFVDKAPMKVGDTLQSLVSSGVKATPALLATLNVYTTTTPSITLTRIPDLNNDTTTRQRHSVTVVLLDASGRRTTESSWTRTFDLNKQGIS